MGDLPRRPLVARRLDRGRPPLLDDSIQRALKIDLPRGPEAFGYASRTWSGALVASHLAQHYGVAIGARQCRRALRNLLAGADSHELKCAVSRQRVAFRSDQLSTMRRRRPPPISSALNQARSLRRLKRLAVAGLAAEPFVMTMFDIIHDGLPSAAGKVFLAGDGSRPNAFIANSSEIAAATSGYEQYFISGPAKLSGFRFRFDSSGFHRLSAKSFWRIEELILPHFYQSEGYNEVLRPIGFHHYVTLRCADAGEVVAFYPVWCGSDIKPFSRDDILFLEACAPLIAHGLKTASSLERIGQLEDGETCVPSGRWPTGVVLMDSSGKPVSIDDGARLIFAQLAAFEPVSDDPVLPQTMRDSLQRIARLMTINGDSVVVAPPVVRVDSCQGGITVKLRATISRGIDGADHLIAVLVERGELRSEKERRLMHRWGLTPNELKILRSLAGGARPRELGAELDVRDGTLKTYVRRLANKVEASSAAGLRTFAAANFN